MSRWRWKSGVIDPQYEWHLALGLSGHDAVRARRILRLPLFDIAVRGHVGLRSCVPRTTA